MKPQKYSSVSNSPQLSRADQALADKMKMVGATSLSRGQVIAKKNQDMLSQRQGEKMRENLTADWAFGIKGAIENIVRNNFRSEIRSWPILQAFDFEAYILPTDYLIIILKDKLSGITAGPGIPKPFPYSDLPTLPPKLSDIELWQFYLKDKFSLKEEDAPFLIPVHDSGCNSAVEDYKLFTTEEKLFVIFQDHSPTF